MAQAQLAIDLSTQFEYVRPHLYPLQYAAIFDERRYSVVEASTKSGKTSGCVVWIVEQALAGKDGNNYWWVAPVSGQAKIAFRRALRALPRDMYMPNLTEMTMTLPNGAVIWFKSGDKPDSLYGEDVYAAVVDEASRLKDDAWYAVRSTLTATRGRVRLIGNVKGRKNWFYKLARKAEAGDPAMGYHKIVAADAVDAGVLDAAEIEDARSQLPENVFRELYLAEASDDGGNPFGLKDIKACVAPLSVNPPAVWGWDLAKKHDWTVGIALDSTNRVCRVVRFQKSWDDTISEIIKITGRLPALVDSTGVGDPILEMLQKGGRHNFEGYLFTSASKQRLMEGLAVTIQSKGTTYPDGPIVNELEEFEYQYTRTGVHYCLGPQTPVLTRDLRWVDVATLKVGDPLLAFDEYPVDGSKSRSWREAKVTATAEIVRPSYRVVFDDGTEVISSAEHRWLVDNGAEGMQWKMTSELRAPHATSKSPKFAPQRLLKLLDVWTPPSNYDAGYLAAAFDGEGHFANSKKAHSGYSTRMGFAQRDNVMADEFRRIMKQFNFAWAEQHKANGGDCISFGLTGRRHEVLRMLGQIRPKRLLEKFDPAKLGTLEKKQYVKPLAIEYLGERPVIALGTTTKTLVAAGIASHNSAPEGFFDDCVCALALANNHRMHARKPMKISDDLISQAAQQGRKR